MLEEAFMDQEFLITGVNKSRVFLQTGSEASFPEAPKSLRHFRNINVTRPPQNIPPADASESIQIFDVKLHGTATSWLALFLVTTT